MKNKNMCTLEELNLQAAMLKGKGDLEGVIRLAEANGLTVRTAERYLMGEEPTLTTQQPIWLLQIHTLIFRTFRKENHMNKRQSKKLYQQRHGYNPGEEERIQLQISDTIKYTECRLVEAEKERVNRTYSGFIESIKQRPRSKARWWRRKR